MLWYSGISVILVFFRYSHICIATRSRVFWLVSEDIKPLSKPSVPSLRSYGSMRSRYILDGYEAFLTMRRSLLVRTVWKPRGRSAIRSSITFSTVTGSAGTQNIIYSQWTVVLFFFGFKYSCLLFFLYNQSQEHDFIGLTLLTLINIPKIKSDYLPNIFIILRERVLSFRLFKSDVEGALRQIKRVRYELIPNKSKKNEWIKNSTGWWPDSQFETAKRNAC